MGAVLAAVGAAATACVAPVGLPAPPPVAGQLVFPVGGRSSFTDSFGAPRPGGRTHQGQDIFAAKMTPAIAAVDGVVSWLRYEPAGNYLILTDDAGWTYYYVHLNNDTPGTDDGRAPYELAFADGIRRGQRVKAGEVIGYVGDSGNAEDTAPHLHFETRQPDGVPVNPYEALRRATRYQRSEAQRLADAPIGAFDAVARSPGGGLRVSGWALDAHLDAPVLVSVYVNGTPQVTARADRPRPDVAAAHPGRSTTCGFEVSDVVAGGAPVPPGAPVAVIAHCIGGGGSTRLGTVRAPE